MVAGAPALADADNFQVAEALSDVAEAQQVDTGEGDFLQPWVDFNAGLISGFDDVVEEKLGLTGTFGFAIIGYTVLVKLATFPLNQQSLRAGALNQMLAPKIKFIQTKYKNDQETQNRMMMRLWDDTGVSPLSGCLPSLFQLPIFIGLYRAIGQLSDKNPHAKEPFLWIPSLSGPTDTQNLGFDWLLKSQSSEEFIPLVGWEDAPRYCILPTILIISQFITQSVTSNQSGSNGGPAAAVQTVIPFVIGLSALASPAGIGIYWFCNNLLTVAQQTVIKKGLAEEFPEYQRMMDGTQQKEEEAKRKEMETLAAAKELEGGLGVGFTSMAESAAIVEEVEKEKVKVGADGTRASARASASYQKRRKSKGRKRR
jgi:YidC/Oxa1 family membrane protein insertase